MNKLLLTIVCDRFFIPLLGTDPIKLSMAKLVAYLMECLAFEMADLLWTLFQIKFTQFVAQNGGSVIRSVTDLNRPKAKEALKQLLKSINKLTKVPCDQ